MSPASPIDSPIHDVYFIGRPHRRRPLGRREINQNPLGQGGPIKRHTQIWHSHTTDKSQMLLWPHGTNCVFKSRVQVAQVVFPIHAVVLLEEILQHLEAHQECQVPRCFPISGGCLLMVLSLHCARVALLGKFEAMVDLKVSPSGSDLIGSR